MKSLLVLAGTAALLAPTPPFPAPKLTGVTPDTKCDWGPITEVRRSVRAFGIALSSSARLATLHDMACPAWRSRPPARDAP